MWRIVNNETYPKVKTDKHLSSEFKFNKGLRQGDAIAPLLVNIVLEIAIRRPKLETSGTIFDKCSQIIAYADDMVVVGRILQEVEEVFTSMVKQTNKMGLEINGEKRETERELMTFIMKALQ